MLPSLMRSGRRSRLSSASSLLSSLHPSRWVRSASTPLSADTTTTPVTATPTHNQTRDKAKIWVRDQAGRFLEQYFKESLGSRHPALTILRRLSAQVDHLAKKPRDGERCLREIQSILVENDISPFEVRLVDFVPWWKLLDVPLCQVTQSGLVPSLLSYLTKPDQDCSGPPHPSHPTTQSHGQGQDHEVRKLKLIYVSVSCCNIFYYIGWKDDASQDVSSRIHGLLQVGRNQLYEI